MNLNEAPAAGFDQPFEMLQACHERVERMLGLFERLAAHLARCGGDAQARDAARDLLRYFDIAGPAHHEDEERHIFPRLNAQGLASDAALVARLQREHRVMSHIWQRVRVDLQALAQERWSGARLALVQRRSRHFAALYRGHIRAEEAFAYPAARALFAPPELDAMGCEMAVRRGVKPPPSA